MKALAHFGNIKVQSQHSKRLTPQLENHVTEWNSCHKCPLAGNAEHHVLFRGNIPCDLLFIGEAPGTSEDNLGVPFIGRSGKLLDKIIDQAIPSKWNARILIANTVACIPLDTEGGIRPPGKDEVAKCLPRLIDLALIAQPFAIVYVGKVASKIDKPLVKALIQAKSKWENDDDFPRCTIFHPAYLLRNGGDSDQNIHYKRTILSLREFARRIFFDEST